MRPERRGGGPTKVRLRTPAERGTRVEILGRGPEAAPRAVEVLRALGLLPA